MKRHLNFLYSQANNYKRFTYSNYQTEFNYFVITLFRKNLKVINTTWTKLICDATKGYLLINNNKKRLFAVHYYSSTEQET